MIQPISMCLVALLLLTAPLAAQSIARASVAEPNTVVIVSDNGQEKKFSLASGYAEVGEVIMSPDGRRAAWILKAVNCCTSYSIPTGLMIYRNGKTIRLEPGLMIHDFAFSSGDTVALLLGHVHGNPTEAVLYGKTGRVKARWDLKGKRPHWAADLATGGWPR